MKIIASPPNLSIIWLIGPRDMRSRLNIRPSAVADTTIGKKNRVRNTWAPRRIESTIRARSSAIPTWNTMVHSMSSRVFPSAVIMFGSVVSSPGTIFR